jgi:hypothetical protein
MFVIVTQVHEWCSTEVFDIVSTSIGRLQVPERGSLTHGRISQPLCVLLKELWRTHDTASSQIRWMSGIHLVPLSMVWVDT